MKFIQSDVSFFEGSTMIINPKNSYIRKQIVTVIYLLTISLFMSACSEPVNYQSQPETSLSFQNSGTEIEANALIPAGPNGLIVSPQTDLIISVGDSVEFSATATDPTGDQSISYVWEFDGLLPNSVVQNPGLVTFQTPGKYEIELITINSLGQTDLTPDKRKIIVQSLAAPQVDSNPVPTIDSPAGDLAINIGDIVNFSGSGVSPVANDPLTFMWDFGDLVADPAVAAPGDVEFTMAGIYTISLNVTDSTGLVSINPAVVTITVNDPNAIGEGNIAPVGTILTPQEDLTIQTGESIFFSSFAIDPDANNPLTYLWDFAGVIPESNQPIPESVAFPTAGVYTITMTVTDALGLSDPTPPQIVVTVADNPVVTAPLLNEVITSPATDITINAGQAVTFLGEGPNELVPGPLSYLWSFGDIAPASIEQNPGDIIFTEIGVFTVSLTISDATGVVISDTVQRQITVLDPNVLQANILTPAGDQTINAGDIVNFTAEVIDPLGITEFEFLWTFEGGVPDSILQSPGDLVFDLPGTFMVNLSVVEPVSGRTVMAEPLKITVLDPNALKTSITTPGEDLTINAGDVVLFAAEVIDPLASSTLEYMWTFGGAAADSMSLDPGEVTFSMSGTFEIEFKVTDTVDLRTAASNVIEITVVDPNALQASIVSPATDMSITVGESINFVGEVTDPLAAVLTYAWDFGVEGAISSELVPGIVQFNAVGDFVVKFSATDPATMRESQIVERIIHVAAAGDVVPPAPQAGPQGSIDSPPGDMTIAVGASLVFAASAVDSAANEPLQFYWNFNNGELSLQVQNPGSVMFNTTGVYTVTLIVKDAAGVVDATPPSITITVN